MTWTYHQSTGDLFHGEVFVGTGYSGHGEGRNNPAMEAVIGVGPIPRGKWTIGKARLSQTTGPVTMDLDPMAGTVTHGRSLFRIHGDNRALNGSASHGCVILARGMRDGIAASMDRVLEVV